LTERTFENNRQIRIWTQVILRVIVILLLLLGVGWLLVQLKTVLLLLVLSIFFCYLIAPAVRLFQQPVYVGGHELRLPRSLAIVAVYVLIGAALYFGTKLLWPQLSDQIADLRRNWDSYVRSGSDTANNFITGANTWMRRLRIPPQWQGYITERLGELAKSSVPLIETFVTSFVSFVPYLTWLIVVPILSFFLLRDAESFEATAIALLPDERLRKRAHWLLLDVSKTIAAYIRAQITSCAVVGILSTIGLYLLQEPYAALVGSLIAVCEFFPMVGPLIGMSVAFLVALTISFKTALAVALFLIVLRIAQDYFIYPRIVGHGIKMHPLLVILAIFGGAEVGGLVGVFFAIPTVAMLLVAYHHYLAYRGIQNLKIVVSPETAERVAEVGLGTDVVAPGD